MKKTRVYELAKEFRKDARELLDLLQEMGIEAVSHASSLSDEEANQVRERLKAAQTHEIVQKRISTGVIRRRKSPLPETASVEEAEAARPPLELEEVEAVDLAVTPTEEVLMEVATEAARPAPEKVEAESQAERPEPRPERPPVRPAPPTADKARIIAPPPKPRVRPEPEPKVEPPVEAAAPAERPVAAPPAPVAPVKPAGQAEPVKVEAAAPATPARAEGPRTAREAAPENTTRVLSDEMSKVKKPRWAGLGQRARIISKPSPTPVVEGMPDLVPPVEEGGGGVKDGKRRRGKAEDRKPKAKKRDVTKAELYANREGRFKGGKFKKGGREPLKPLATQPRAGKMKVKVAEAISVMELAKRLGVKATEVVKQLLTLGMIVTLNQTIDLDTATLVANEFGYEVEKTGFEESDLLKDLTDRDEDLSLRPPVVTIMGHVDHGKSSLLEALSTHNISIVQGEAGGITQHIGAYRVAAPGGDIVFLDTPGHEAFTAMRARGAQVTDIVVLVVAADDGVMEQTKEAINHAKAANVPIIVAVNKMDKPTADPDRVKRELAEQGLLPEEWGGETLYTYVSAKTGLGLDDLLEAIRLQAEVLELRGNPDRPALGRIVEARLDRGRGAVATVLIQTGTLKVGDIFVVGAQHGKIRALFDERGRPLDQAGPSIPVQIQGLSGVPEAGDEFRAVEDEKVARQISEHRLTKKREAELSQTTRLSLENFLQQAKSDETKELNIVIKADVQGSIEALREALEKLSTDKVRLSVIHSGVGAITETDIMLASASKAIIIGFNVRANPKVNEVIEAQKVEVRYYDIIYKAIEDVREAMTGLLASVFKEHVLGHAEIRQVFKVPKVGNVAGCYVSDGQMKRGGLARLIRDGKVVYTGRIVTLRRIKDDVREVASGFECGINLENFNDIKVGDTIETYEMEEIRPTLI